MDLLLKFLRLKAYKRNVVSQVLFSLNVSTTAANSCVDNLFTYLFLIYLLYLENH